jgi:hypothetical protein
MSTLKRLVTKEREESETNEETVFIYSKCTDGREVVALKSRNL